MNKALYAGFLFLIISTSATVLQADDSSAAKKMAPVDRYIAQFSERLELSDEQTQRIKPVLVANAGAMMAAMQRQHESLAAQSSDEEGISTEDSLKLADEIDLIRAATMEKLAIILTPEQLATYKLMQDEGSRNARTLIRSK